MLTTVADLLLVVIGFCLIVVIHELGHFLAARWAGIRVLAFAVGFGPALLSYRKGMGVRGGSSEPEYLAKVAAGRRKDGLVPGVSPTEYRLNALPFGGYVKMLGQDDLDASAVSAAADSYQNAPVWKRMVVISAGVVMNLLSAAALFIIVFMVGLKVEAPIIGWVAPGSAAESAALIGGPESAGPGIKPGDRVVRVADREPISFSDITVAGAMAGPGESVRLEVMREGFDAPLVYSVRPIEGKETRLLEIGAAPAQNLSLVRVPDSMRAKFAERMETLGLAGVEPGMRVAAVNGAPAPAYFHDFAAAFRDSGGRPVAVRFEGADGKSVEKTVDPKPVYELAQVRMRSGATAPISHIAGLMPVMMVGEAGEGALGQGLRDGDIFARLGGIEYPSLGRGLMEIQSHAGRALPIVVLRRDESGLLSEVSLPAVRVNRKGQIGFLLEEWTESAVLGAPVAELLGRDDKPIEHITAGEFATAGMKILAIDGKDVRGHDGIWSALRGAALRAPEGEGLTVRMEVQRPVEGQPRQDAPVETVRFELKPAQVLALKQLTWRPPIGESLFEYSMVVAKGEGPVDSLRMGLAETRRVMLMTYVTFARLFQGTVKVEHLKGPVGIAHVGTLLAGRGFVWLLFFLALISVNLAVINFLPLPIADGGQFLFLLYEGVRGRPAPIGVQNAAVIAGLILIGTVFLFVTFNDIRTLLGF